MTKRTRDLTETIQVRVSEFEKNRIKWLADRYACGNMSLYMVWAAIDMPRKEIGPEVLAEYSNRRKKNNPTET